MKIMMRSLGISLISLVLTTVVIANAYYQKKQFYPSVVYITKSNPSMAVIYVQAFICVWLAGKIMKKLFFGQLRTAEFEHLMERSWYAVTETCLAFTVFRDDFNPKFVALFTLLLFLKSFHWLAEDRVDYMERSPVISWLFHIRVLSLLLLLGSLDFYFIQHAYHSTITKGASVQLVFGFEYAILLTVALNIAIKYILHSIDLNRETPWESKAVFLLYTELIMGLIKVILYVSFVAIMVRIYTLPLFAFRPMYYTIRNFKKAFSDVILSRRAIHNMNTLYPDATPEELQAADNVCIICREEMTTASKKLPCNHIFHTSCLRSWFQRQQTCPTCRLNILRAPNNNNDPRADQQQHRQAPQNQANIFFNHLANQNVFRMFNQPPPNQAEGQVPAAAAGAVPNQVPPQVNTGAVPPPTSQQPQAGTIPPPIGFPPFPFLPFMAPPPIPPQNLQSLTADELRRLEGNERENIEARIQCLRNIQIMLDAAVLMMQQYSAAAALSMQMPIPPGQQSPPQQQVPSNQEATFQEPGATAAANPSTNPESTLNSKSDQATENGSLPGSSYDDVSEEQSCAGKKAQPEPVNTEFAEQSNGPVTPEEELRRRRLQRFQQTGDTQ